MAPGRTFRCESDDSATTLGCNKEFDATFFFGLVPLRQEPFDSFAQTGQIAAVESGEGRPAMPAARDWPGGSVTTPLHPLATQHLPSFVSAPGETDTLFLICCALLIGAVLAVGLLFLHLHTLPERMAHRTHKLQFEIVAVLGLLALFTHMHIFWVIGLLLALIEIPDVWTPLRRMAGALEKIAGIPPEPEEEQAPEPAAPIATAPPPAAAATLPAEAAAQGGASHA
ncbi:hypothetical protein [Bosea sp. (in: a-proteobacteria)]|uniref:hypothetical protein n=1 Tax=Bosea sp. (in: a-proteobacteria) TaxID=1871050 RepID=UPI003B3AFC27